MHFNWFYKIFLLLTEFSFLEWEFADCVSQILKFHIHFWSFRKCEIGCVHPIDNGNFLHRTWIRFVQVKQRIIVGHFIVFAGIFCNWILWCDCGRCLTASAEFRRTRFIFSDFLRHFGLFIIFFFCGRSHGMWRSWWMLLHDNRLLLNSHDEYVLLKMGETKRNRKNKLLNEIITTKCANTQAQEEEEHQQRFIQTIHHHQRNGYFIMLYVWMFILDRIV